MNQNYTPQYFEFLCDILITAVESGIIYWCNATNYKYVENFRDYPGDPRYPVDAHADLTYEDENDNIQHFHLTPLQIDVGYKELIETGQSSFTPATYENLVTAYTTLDSGFIDGWMADSIVQFAVFGRIVMA